jgi:hypothetical protein
VCVFANNNPMVEGIFEHATLFRDGSFSPRLTDISVMVCL